MTQNRTVTATFTAAPVMRTLAQPLTLAQSLPDADADAGCAQRVR